MKLADVLYCFDHVPLLDSVVLLRQVNTLCCSPY